MCVCIYLYMHLHIQQAANILLNSLCQILVKLYKASDNSKVNLYLAWDFSMCFVCCLQGVEYGVGRRRRALSNNLTPIPNWLDTGSYLIVLASHPNTMANRAEELTRQQGQPTGYLHPQGSNLPLTRRATLGLSVLTTNSIISQV